MDLDKALAVLRRMSEEKEDSGEKTFAMEGVCDWRERAAKDQDDFYVKMLEEADALKLAIELLS